MLKKILLVEDEPTTQTVLKGILAQIDPEFQVHTALSAEEAYRVLRGTEWDTPFDLVISDVNLPSSNGLTLQQVSRKRFPGLAFLFISGTSYEDWQHRIEFLERSPPFLRKPITLESLKSYFNRPFLR